MRRDGAQAANHQLAIEHLQTVSRPRHSTLHTAPNASTSCLAVFHDWRKHGPCITQLSRREIAAAPPFHRHGSLPWFDRAAGFLRPDRSVPPPSRTGAVKATQDHGSALTAPSTMAKSSDRVELAPFGAHRGHASDAEHSQTQSAVHRPPSATGAANTGAYDRAHCACRWMPGLRNRGDRSRPNAAVERRATPNVQVVRLECQNGVLAAQAKAAEYDRHRRSATNLNATWPARLQPA